MICFRDMTFCGSDCVNEGCHRHFGEDDKEAAERWWNPTGKKLKEVHSIEDMSAPVAFSDFSDDCKEYVKP